MGMFDDAFKTETPSLNTVKEQLTVQEAFAAVALAVSAVDGSIDDSELDWLGMYIGQMRMFKNHTNEQVAAMFTKLIDILDRKGVVDLVKVAKTKLPVKLRETAFACAVDIAFADGVLADSEKELLKELQKFLEVPAKTASMIAQVAVIRHRGHGQW